MPILKKTMIAAFLTAVTLGGTSVQAELYNCSINVNKGSWIMPVIVVARKGTQTKDVLVNDALIGEFNGGPLGGKVIQDNAKRFKVSWEVRNVKAGHQQVARFKYSLTYFKGNKKAVVTAIPHGFADHFTARGSCQVRQS